MLNRLSVKKYYFFLFPFISILILLNMSRNIENDLNNYLDVFYYLNNNNLTNLFTSSEFFFAIKPTEPFFYILTFILVKVSFGKTYFYLGYLTLIIYFNLIFGFRLLLKSFNISNTFYFYFIVFIFGCINFSETSHLLRQYLAGSFIPIFLYSLFANKFPKILFFSSIIILTHNSMFIIISLLLISHLFCNFQKKKHFVFSILVILFYFLFIFLCQKYLVSLSYNDEPGKFNNLSFYYDFILLSTYLLISLFFRDKLPKWHLFFLVFTCLFVLFLSLITYSEILFIRFYLNIEWFRIFYFILILETLRGLYFSNSLRYFTLIIVVMIFFLRLYVSPWNYFSFEMF
jgi:hypothetical protein